MNKEFVPHEQSLELRKLKFDEPCLGFYVGKDKEVFMSSNDFNAPFQFRLDSKTTFVAPTFSQAFRWFREKYELDYEITYGGKKGEYRAFVKSYIYGNNGNNPSIFSYEEAELECLKKLIEIAKEKKNETK